MLSLVGGGLFLAGMPAFAKMPPRTCELSTTSPVVGQPVRVEIKFWNDAAHTDPATWWDVFPRMRDFVEARAIDRGTPGEYVLGVLHATVVRTRPGVYWGVLVFPDTRRFRVARCGESYERGYPVGSVIVRPRRFVRTDPGNAGRAPAQTSLGEVAAIAAVGLGFAALLRRRIREHSALKR